jgi:protein tyrosine/serine phosphatase
MKVIIALACAAFLGLSGCASNVSDPSSASANALTEPPPNFAKVRDGLYRGGHPTAGALDYLSGLGVETIVDLEIADLIEAMPWDISGEERDATAKGFTFVRKPMSAFEPAESARFDAQMDEIIALLRGASAAHPVYVHCKHGQDRTGLVIGLERVLVEGMAPADAYAEMIRYGFHPAFLGLNHYFETKTGWDD